MKTIVYILTCVVILFGGISCSKNEADSVEPENKTWLGAEVKTVENTSGTGSVSNPERKYYSLELNKEIASSEANSKNWDISFERTKIYINSQFGAKGLVIKNQIFDTLVEVPLSGYKNDGEFDEISELDPSMNNMLFANWYTLIDRMGANDVVPRNNVYVIKTTAGNFVKLKILSYYYNSPGSRISSAYMYSYAKAINTP